MVTVLPLTVTAALSDVAVSPVRVMSTAVLVSTDASAATAFSARVCAAVLPPGAPATVLTAAEVDDVDWLTVSAVEQAPVTSANDNTTGNRVFRLRRRMGSP